MAAPGKAQEISKWGKTVHIHTNTSCCVYKLLSCSDKADYFLKIELAHIFAMLFWNMCIVKYFDFSNYYI